jgi:hypothetical protein
MEKQSSKRFETVASIAIVALFAGMAMFLNGGRLAAQMSESQRTNEALAIRAGYHREMWENGVPDIKGLLDEAFRKPQNWVHVIARHADGRVFLDEWSHNLRTNAGEVWQEGLMGANSGAASALYIALTNTAITPATTDTTLSGEIAANGLSRTLGTAAYYSSGIWSGTYTSGGSITGSTGQTCTLATFGNSCSGTAASVALTSTNTIAGSTALVFSNHGTSCTAASTSATLGSGTATCSGSATLSTVFGANVYSVSNTFTATGTQAAQAAGIFTAGSVGTMVFESTFIQASLAATDTLAVSDTITF